VKYFEEPMKNKAEVVVHEKKSVDTMHVSTPPGDQTFKILIKQLKESRKEVAKLKKKSMSERVNMIDLMDGYSHTLDLARFAARRTQPLHR
jgi:hypothetical protein